jgi:hypothetical protein
VKKHCQYEHKRALLALSTPHFIPVIVTPQNHLNSTAFKINIKPVDMNTEPFLIMELLWITLLNALPQGSGKIQNENLLKIYKLQS